MVLSFGETEALESRFGLPSFRQRENTFFYIWKESSSACLKIWMRSRGLFGLALKFCHIVHRISKASKTTGNFD